MRIIKINDICNFIQVITLNEFILKILFSLNILPLILKQKTFFTKNKEGHIHFKVYFRFYLSFSHRIICYYVIEIFFTHISML